MAPRESPLSVYASKVGSDANVCPDKPKSRLTLSPLLYVAIVPAEYQHAVST